MKKVDKYEQALKRIASSYLELSHDKCMAQRNEFVKIARIALNSGGGRKANIKTQTSTKDLDNDF